MDVSTHRTFDIGNCLGKGGFGEVYRATMSSSGGLSREVAIKLLRADLDMHDDAVRRLRDEGRLLAGLDHPALLKVYDLVELAGRVALVTEFIDGEDLTECFRARPAMPPRALLEAIAKVAEALHVAWTAPLGPNGRALRLVHRDIKPSNLRIGRHGQVKVLDFGIARSDEVARESRTSTDLIIGSPAYMAPERFLDNEVRSASDVFALGCCLYEGLMGGERLFGGQSAMVLSTLALDSSRFDAFLSDRPLPESLDASVRELVAACLHHDPEQRPTAQQLARRCEELADELPGASLARWARNREWPTSGIGVPSSLVGQVVTEGSLAMSVQPVTEDTATRSGSMVMYMGSAAVAMLVVGVVVIVGAGGAAVAWQQGLFTSASATEQTAVDEVPMTAPADEPADTAAPVDVPRVAAPDPIPDAEPVRVAPRSVEVPASVAPVVPQPAPTPAPTAPSPATVAPEPAPTPRPEPQVTAPTPRAAPASQPVPAGSVRLEGSMTTVWLSRDGQRIDLSGAAVSVPEGRWTLRSTDSVNGSVDHGTVRVMGGASLTVQCSQPMASCRPR